MQGEKRTPPPVLKRKCRIIVIFFSPISSHARRKEDSAPRFEKEMSHHCDFSFAVLCLFLCNPVQDFFLDEGHLVQNCAAVDEGWWRKKNVKRRFPDRISMDVDGVDTGELLYEFSKKMLSVGICRKPGISP